MVDLLVWLKPGERISEKRKRVTVGVENIKDLSRDVIKSNSAGVVIPELDLELTSGTLGGIVTTAEGLVTKISEKLKLDKKSNKILHLLHGKCDHEVASEPGADGLAQKGCLWG
ncbi:hypothetical protein Drorol1_Dr00027273 [Drosera rotundifolia]